MRGSSTSMDEKVVAALLAVSRVLLLTVTFSSLMSLLFCWLVVPSISRSEPYVGLVSLIINSCSQPGYEPALQTDLTEQKFSKVR